MKVKIRDLANLVEITIPLFIIVAIDGSFSIQSIIVPIVCLLLLAIISKARLRVTSSDGSIIALYVIPIVASLMINIMFGEITNLYIIRICYTVIILLFYILMMNFPLSENGIKLLMYSSILSGIVISFYFMFVQKIWYHNILGTEIDKNFTGGLLAIYSQFAFLMFYYQKRKLKKIVFLFIWCVLNIGIFYSGSRASILVSIIGAIIIILEDMINDAKKRKNVWKVLLLVVAFLAVMALIPKIDAIMSNTSKFQWYWNRYFKNSYIDTSNNTRIEYWTSGIKLWLSRPIFGNGPGYITLTKTGSAVAHNTIIDYLADIGIVGTCGFLAIWARSTKKLFFSRKRTFRSLPISLFVFSMILSLNRSVLLWMGLILCWNISNNIDGFFDEINQ